MDWNQKNNLEGFNVKSRQGGPMALPLAPPPLTKLVIMHFVSGGGLGGLLKISYVLPNFGLGG